jgi:hypothetical protein
MKTIKLFIVLSLSLYGIKSQAQNLSENVNDVDLLNVDNTRYTITFTISLSSYERDIKTVESIIQSFKTL